MKRVAFLLSLVVLALLIALFVLSSSKKTSNALSSNQLTPTSTGPTPKSKNPIIIHHAKPSLKVDTAWIKNAGCTPACPPESPLYKLGCEEIVVEDVYGGLAQPVVRCVNRFGTGNAPINDHFIMTGCTLSTRHEALITFKNGAYEFVTRSKLESFSVPIDSPDEALSYALASTKYLAWYDTESTRFDSEYYFVDKVDETFVTETQEGYRVHLFSEFEPKCSCAEHFKNQVDVLIGRDGSIGFDNFDHFYKVDFCAD